MTKALNSEELELMVEALTTPNLSKEKATKAGELKNRTATVEDIINLSYFVGASAVGEYKTTQEQGDLEIRQTIISLGQEIAVQQKVITALGATPEQIKTATDEVQAEVDNQIAEAKKQLEDLKAETADIQAKADKIAGKSTSKAKLQKHTTKKTVKNHGKADKIAGKSTSKAKLQKHTTKKTVKNHGKVVENEANIIHLEPKA